MNGETRGLLEGVSAEILDLWWTLFEYRPFDACANSTFYYAEVLENQDRQYTLVSAASAGCSANCITQSHPHLDLFIISARCTWPGETREYSSPETQYWVNGTLMQELGHGFRMERATATIQCRRIHGYRQPEVAVDGE